MGIKSNVPFSSLSSSNANRHLQIYNDLAMVLITHAQLLFDKNELTESVKALDSSTIDLCLSLFHWAEFRDQIIRLTCT